MKHAITLGNFDCLSTKHVHLINQMRKAVLPDGEIICLLRGDYQAFLLDKKFPLQGVELRYRNLKYLCENVQEVFQQDISSLIVGNKNTMKEGDKFIVFCYEEDKETDEIKFCRKNKINVRIIKPPKI